MSDKNFADQFAQARAGDEVAARELLDRFGPEIRQVARGKLPRSLRARFDSIDIVQSIWKSLFAKDGQILEKFETSRHFVGYLAGMARNKVNQEHRKTRTRKYDMGREEPLIVRRGDQEFVREVRATDPSPSQNAQANDRLAQILQGRSELERRVVELRRDGLTYDEIAVELSVHEATVRRIIEAIRLRLDNRQWR
jgi:RNA polymerase sigma factor (sigma-70 family)